MSSSIDELVRENERCVSRVLDHLLKNHQILKVAKKHGINLSKQQDEDMRAELMSFVQKRMREKAVELKTSEIQERLELRDELVRSTPQDAIGYRSTDDPHLECSGHVAMAKELYFRKLTALTATQKVEYDNKVELLRTREAELEKLCQECSIKMDAMQEMEVLKAVSGASEIPR